MNRVWLMHSAIKKRTLTGNCFPSFVLTSSIGHPSRRCLRLHWLLNCRSQKCRICLAKPDSLCHMRANSILSWNILWNRGTIMYLKSTKHCLLLTRAWSEHKDKEMSLSMRPLHERKSLYYGCKVRNWAVICVRNEPKLELARNIGEYCDSEP